MRRVGANRCRELLPGLIDRSITCAMGWTHRELLATLQYLFGGVAFAGDQRTCAAGGQSEFIYQSPMRRFTDQGGVLNHFL